MSPRSMNPCFLGLIDELTSTKENQLPSPPPPPVTVTKRSNYMSTKTQSLRRVLEAKLQRHNLKPSSSSSSSSSSNETPPEPSTFSASSSLLHRIYRPEFATNGTVKRGDRESDLSSAGSRISLLSSFRGVTATSDLSVVPRITTFTLPTQALVTVLQDSALKDRFREHLCMLTMTETLDCIDSITSRTSLSRAQDRILAAQMIIERFVLDSSSQQVNTSSNLKHKLQLAYQECDTLQLGSVDFFRELHNELFKDIRQSDAFRTFIEHDVLALRHGSNPGI